MAVGQPIYYFRYYFFESNRQTLSKTTKWVEDGNRAKLKVY